MANLNELELQNLRHLIGGHDTIHCKLSAYAQDSKDPAIKQYFEKSAASAKQAKEQLMGFLN